MKLVEEVVACDCGCWVNPDACAVGVWGFDGGALWLLEAGLGGGDGWVVVLLGQEPRSFVMTDSKFPSKYREYLLFDYQIINSKFK